MSEEDSTAIPPSRVPSGFQFREPWCACSLIELQQELERELSVGSCLFGVTACTVARRKDCDDVLFELFGDHAPGEFAKVHLVWSGKYPRITVYPTFQHWVSECMQPEADEWETVEKHCDDYNKSRSAI